jgi:hypothetical protein
VERNLLIASTAPIVHRVGGSYWVTWPHDREHAFSIAPDEFASVAEYRRFLDRRLYTAVLTDGSLLQLSYVFTGGEITKHRLCYYPCPVALSDLNPDEESFAELFDQHLLESANFVGENAPGSGGFSRDRLRLRSPIRFDYDPDAAQPGHPHSHMTLCSADCRIPVYGPLSPGHFVRFVFSRFYPAQWESQAVLRDWPTWRGKRSISEDEELELYLECRMPA